MTWMHRVSSLASAAAKPYRSSNDGHAFRADALGRDAVADLVRRGAAAARYALLLRLVPEHRLAHPQSGFARDRARALGLSSRPLLGSLCRAGRIRRRSGARA